MMILSGRSTLLSIVDVALIAISLMREIIINEQTLKTDMDR
jgi:hypothetical protein